MHWRQTWVRGIARVVGFALAGALAVCSAAYADSTAADPAASGTADTAAPARESARSVDAPVRAGSALETSQAAIGRQVGNYHLVDSSGRPFELASLRGRPVLLSLVYTSCYSVCSGLTVSLRAVARTAREALGPGSFTLLTVGFDTPNDTPERMRLYASERGAVQPDWIFASGDADTVARLARDVGFTWAASAKGFDHITQTTIIDANGRVALQVYGASPLPPSVVEPLKRIARGEALQQGSLAGLLRSVQLLCTIYDPASGRYRFDYSIVTELIAGVLALGMVAIAIGRSWRSVV
ncbi:MAG: SCO family protein [Steroidobacteraceae bacterium]